MYEEKKPLMWHGRWPQQAEPFKMRVRFWVEKIWRLKDLSFLDAIRRSRCIYCWDTIRKGRNVGKKDTYECETNPFPTLLAEDTMSFNIHVA